MFPHPNRPAHAWLDAVRHGLDLLVAFATLRDAEAPPEYGGTVPGAGLSWPRADAIPPATAAGRRAAERARQRAAESSDRRAAAGVDHATESLDRRRAEGVDRAADSSDRRAADSSGRAADSSDRRAADRSDRRAADRSGRAADRSGRAADRSDRRAADQAGRRPTDGSHGPAPGRAKPPAPAHPHRRPLRPATRLRRPGAVRPEPQPCLTPIVARRARPTRAPARGARH
jgi:hypothetical protein